MILAFISFQSATIYKNPKSLGDQKETYVCRKSIFDKDNESLRLKQTALINLFVLSLAVITVIHTKVW